MVIENLCPVCVFEMEEPPRDYNICPSCGTEFGVHDVNASIAQLRAAWIRNGPKWWSETDPQPIGWNPFAQLATLGRASTSLGITESVFLIDSTTTSVPSYPVTISDLTDWTLDQREDKKHEVASS